MNRIYQGRVSTVEILKSGTTGRTAEYAPLNAEAKVALRGTTAADTSHSLMPCQNAAPLG